MLTITTFLMAYLVKLQDTLPNTPDLKTAIIASVQVGLSWASDKLYQGIKTILPFWDKQDAKVHMAAAPFLGLLFGFLAAHFGVGVITDVHALDAAWVNNLLDGLLNAGLMAGFFRDKKLNKPVDATVVLESTRASK